MTFTASYRHQDGEKTNVHSVSFSEGTEPTRRTALGFNPGAHKPTFDVKIACAAAMETIGQQRKAEVTRHNNRLAEIDRMERSAQRSASDAENRGHADAMRCFATALTQLESAQMFAVKGLHAPANAGG